MNERLLCFGKFQSIIAFFKVVLMPTKQTNCTLAKLESNFFICVIPCNFLVWAYSRK